MAVCGINEGFDGAAGSAAGVEPVVGRSEDVIFCPAAVERIGDNPAL
ncbi:hypothetical protein RQN30_02240 [Arcanobacterium hippocoleae]